MISISPQERFEYVKVNFQLVYSVDIEQYISYSKAENKNIFIPDLSDNFFNSLTKIEEKQVQYFDIYNEKIPLYFTNESAEIIKKENNVISFNCDIISNIFLHLSGWLELDASKDKLGRYTFENSIHQKLGIAQLPIVSYLFEVLKKNIEQISNQKIENKYQQHAKYYAWITHDIDIINNSWKSNLKNLFKSLNYKHLYYFIESFNQSNSFNKIGYFQKKHGFKSTYFFLPSRGKYLGFDNADYQFSSESIQKIIKSLKSLGNSIGIHGAFESSFDGEVFQNGYKKFENKPTVNRFHFLMFDSTKSVDILENSEIKIDSTLGYNDTPGFRNSTTYPFYLFNFNTKKASFVLEIPLILMDVSLLGEQYLNIKSSEEALSYLKPLFMHYEKLGGVFTINWHNNYFVETQKALYQETFDKVLFKIKEKSKFIVL